MRRLKAAAIIALLSISTGVFGSHIAESLWPWIPVSVGVAVLVVLSGVLWQPDQESPPDGPALVFVIGIAVFYRTYTFVFPASMIGLDPDQYAVWINQLVAAGSIEAMDVGFYQNAPFFPLLNGLFSIISGLPVRTAMIITPLLTGILIPLSIYAIVVYFTEEQVVRVGITASLIGAVATQGVKLSYWPIPQMLATLFLCLLVVVTIRSISAPRRGYRFSVLFVAFLLSLSLTHKLPMLVVVLFVGTFAILFLFPKPIARRLGLDERGEYRLWILFGIASMMLFVQWTYIADFFDSVVIKLGALLGSGPPKISPALMNPTAAVSPYPQVVGILLQNLHALALLVIGAVAWLILAYTNRSKRSVQTLLAVTAILFLLFPITIIVPSEFIYTRVTLFIEPFLAAIIAAAFVRQSNRSQQLLSRALSVATVGILVFVIVTQVVAVGAAPDFPGAPRMYLTSEEVTAKEFGYQHLDDSVAGPYYAHERPFPDQQVAATGALSGRANTYAPLTESLYNATLISDCHPNVLYRQIAVYRFQGPWQLTWNPQPALDGHYNRIYANGGAQHYSRTKCRGTNSTVGV